MANMAPSMEVVNSSLQQQCEYPRSSSGSPAVGGPPNSHKHTNGGDLKSASNHSSSGHDVDDDGNATEDNWDNVVKPGLHDVLLGRGGGTNNHTGNVKFRQLVNEHKMRYLACSKVDKPKVAREVVQLWRKMDPPGRFLARKDETKKGPGSVKSEDNVWFEVGDKKANAKASQCLRERTPDVMPYLRQLREQQDLNTEHGVRMVRQHQMEMQEQYRMQGGIGPQCGMQGGDYSSNPAFGGSVMASPVPTSPYGRSASLALPGPNGTVMMSPNTRRMSMPSMAGGPSSPYQGRGDAGPQPAFYDEPGTPSSHGGGGGVQSRLGQQGAYTGDMTDMEYEQHMMIMQQQLQMQQMQLQRMQQQRVMQRQAMTQQQQHLSCMSPMSIASPRKLGLQQHQQQQQQQQQQMQQPFSQQMQQAIAPPGLVGSNDITPHAVPSSPSAIDRRASKKLPSPTSVAEHDDPLSVDHDPLQDLTRSKANVSNNSSANKKNKRSLAESSRSKDGPATRGVPDRNPSFMSLGEEGELTLEEYRQQLEEYILNNQITSNENGGLDEEDDDCEDDEDDDKFDEDDASDLEDDWEKEKEKAYRHQQHHLSPQRGRGLDRTNTKSACSFMSVQTNSSMLSGVSTFSELGDLEMSTGSGLAHLDDADDDADNQGLGIKSGGAGAGGGVGARAPPRDRSRGVDRAVSGASMLSMMSELTDLSQNVDNLSLYDD